MQAKDFTILDYSPDLIVEKILPNRRRVLLFGEAGVGKSTLAATLAPMIRKFGIHVWCIGADPGSPGFGIPGAVCRGKWQEKGWKLVALEALCTLDAGRFRLPLISAVRRLAVGEFDGVLLVDTPGVIRGVSGAELLLGLVDAVEIDLILVLVRETKTLPLPNEFSALGVEMMAIRAHPNARRPGKRIRARVRTHQWDAFLAKSEERHIRLSDVKLIGTPPPGDAPVVWSGRQVGILDRSRTITLGEVKVNDGVSLYVRMPPIKVDLELLVVRDARRGEDGLLDTAKPFGTNTLQYIYIPPPDIRPYPSAGSYGGPTPVTRVGSVIATLVNGIFGDPLLHLRFRHWKRSLLFDLGEGARLPSRVAHQVSDVFISHAHIDHIGGFLWLLRSRIGDFPSCRIFGPPGLAKNVEGLVRGILWDRIGSRGPRFEIAELHGDYLVRFMVQAGYSGVRQLAAQAVREGVILEEEFFCIRAVTLDHGTPVLAFACEQPKQFNVRKERLVARGLVPGPWLSELKQCLARDERQALIHLPDGHVKQVGELADDLVLITPGQKLAYATDLADSADNRERLTALAKGAHTFFCEASFVSDDADQAKRTGHLTATTCGEIANAAGTKYLVPFHFSRRYENEPERVYDEIRSVCSCLVIPK